ncbi:MAG TPA: NAD(+) diphosphatase [Steroidobacteraceae bacterium]|nr:NAD(+) diphosphatase [Steroidobacteraceae bacterium]
MTADRQPPNFFSGPYIDRRAELRELAHWLDEARSDSSTLYLAARGTAHLLRRHPDAGIAFLPSDHPAVAAASSEQLVLLGWFRGTRCLLVELGDAADPVDFGGAQFEELRPVAPLLPAEDAGLLAYARALSIWRARHRFCSVCGCPMRAERAGHVLRCSNDACAAESFPRIDPAIIVLIKDRDRVLLGRQASWPPGRYSTIAGFVEPGESLEDAVEREVMEETGVAARDVAYHSSQPWPFPSSLMVGFHATADSSAPLRVSGELADARWFSRAEIAAGKPPLPPNQSISYRLIRGWADSAAPAE